LKLDLKKIGLEFWTSGSNEGEFCNAQNVYTWCSIENGTLFQQHQLPGSDMWRNSKAKDFELDRCVVYKLNESTADKPGLEHSACSAKKFYICEVFIRQYFFLTSITTFYPAKPSDFELSESLYKRCNRQTFKDNFLITRFIFLDQTF
jgi:hypothetical protein